MHRALRRASVANVAVIAQEEVERVPTVRLASTLITAASPGASTPAMAKVGPGRPWKPAVKLRDVSAKSCAQPARSLTSSGAGRPTANSCVSSPPNRPIRGLGRVAVDDEVDGSGPVFGKAVLGDDDPLHRHERRQRRASARAGSNSRSRYWRGMRSPRVAACSPRYAGEDDAALEVALAVAIPERAIDITSPRRKARIDGAGHRIDIAAPRNLVGVVVAPRITNGEAGEKRRAEPAVDPASHAADLVIDTRGGRRYSSIPPAPPKPVSHCRIGSRAWSIGPIKPHLVMHRVEEHARGFDLDGRDVGVRLAAELQSGLDVQRRTAADIDQIEAVVDQVHVGEELGERGRYRAPSPPRTYCRRRRGR